MRGRSRESFEQRWVEGRPGVAVGEHHGVLECSENWLVVERERGGDSMWGRGRDERASDATRETLLARLSPHYRTKSPKK